MTERIIIFTDGAAKGNPGPGGWGAIIHDGETVTELGGSAPTTTNNRMEMEAAIRSLEAVRSKSRPVLIHTDSTYLIQGITQWIHGWRRKGWKTAQGGDVLNRDLWEQLDALVKGSGSPVRWAHVPGHAGVPGNERADTIASELALDNPIELYRGAADLYPVDLNATVPGTAPVRSPRKRTSNGKAHSYLSLVGGIAQRHQTWAECEQRVRGVSGARFKKAMSREDEAAILATWGVSL